jgi:hypothetical protein
VTGRRGRRHKQIPNNLKEKIVYWTLKKEFLCGELALEGVLNLERQRMNVVVKGRNVY